MRCRRAFAAAQADVGRRRVLAFAKATWTNVNVRCGSGRYATHSTKNRSYATVEIKFTRSELKEWCLRQSASILALRRPSIDRIDDDGHYEFGNIQVIELRDNVLKSARTVFAGGAGRCSRCQETKPMDQFVTDRRRVNGRGSICKRCDSNRLAVG